jgi:WD40 repeat protein
VRQVARWGLQAAEALAYAHAQGILHRDVKPGNLLVDARGNLWVADFGLAKAEGVADLTESGELVGTVRYLAPERFNGRADARSDVYALGLTLYELLTLRPAFDTPDLLKLLEDIERRQPPRPRSIDPRIPRDLETVVLKAMSKPAAQRYASAAEVADDLRRFLADEPVRARPIAWHTHFRRWCRRNPLPAALAAAVLLLIVAVAVVSSIANLRLTAQSKELSDALGQSEELRQEGLAKLWDSAVQRARAVRSSHGPGQRFDALRAVREALRLPLPPGRSRDELRTEAAAALLLPDLETAWEWHGLASETSVIAFDRDFLRFACSDPKGAVSVRSGADREELYRLPGPGVAVVAGGLQFSPDGHYLNVTYPAGKGRKHRLWQLGGPREQLLREDDWLGFTFSPDGREFAARSPDGSIRIIALSTRAERTRLPCQLTREPSRLAWNPLLPQIVVHTSFAWEALSLENGRTLQTQITGVVGLSCHWRLGGHVLAITVSLQRAVAFWDATSWQKLWALHPVGTHNDLVFAFDHSGGLAASNDSGGVLQLWHVEAGREMLVAPARSPLVQFRGDDGQLAAAAEGTLLRVWRCASGREWRALAVPNPRLRAKMGQISVNCRPGSDVVAVGCPSGVALIDLADALQVGFIPLDWTQPLLFEPDGQGLLTYRPQGILRWPLSDTAGGALRCGPPQQVVKTYLSVLPAAVSRDGRVAAFSNYSATTVWDRARTGVGRLGGTDHFHYCAVSPDGKWVAAGRSSHGLYQSTGALIYETQTGKVVTELPAGSECGVVWSPDGSWLLTTGGREYRLWDAATWKQVCDYGTAPPLGTAVFSPDARLLAVAESKGTVRLLSVPSGQEIGRLATPEPGPVHPRFFTADGARLVAYSHDREVLFVFDLRLIRAGLAEIGLDWDDSVWPYFPPPQRTRHLTHLDVDLGQFAPPAQPAPPQK